MDPCVGDKPSHDVGGDTLSREHSIVYTMSDTIEDQKNVLSDISKALSSSNVAQFPSLAGTNSLASPLMSSICLISLEQVPTTFLAEVLQLSWALLLSHYTCSNDVVFGAQVWMPCSPESEVFGRSRSTNTHISTPLFLEINSTKSIRESVEDVRRHFKSFSTIKWQDVHLESSYYARETKTLLGYQNQLNVSLGQSRSEFLGLDFPSNPLFADLGCTPPLIMNCMLSSDNDILCRAHLSRTCLDKEQVESMVHQFASIAEQLLHTNGDVPIGEIEFPSPRDLTILAEWNYEVDQGVTECLHDLVSFHSLVRPEKIAVCAWDGELSYALLDAFSSQLAYYLREKGIVKGDIVPLIFEKSMWSIVAMLAVLKAGGVCVAIDVRNRDSVAPAMFQRTKAKFVLTSESQASQVPETKAQVVVVSAKNAVEWTFAAPSAKSQSQPSDLTFIIFTSGSTGRPKGILFDHTALATSMRAHGQSLNMHQNSRVLRFSSYAFDVSIYEIFTTLILGATVCVPSESQRMANISAFIKENHVNWAWFTPSFLRTLQPHEVPSLATIAVGGEAVTEDNVKTWADKVELINGYGPAECTICASGRLSAKDWIPGTFGRTVGCTSWITVPSDPNKISAIGAIGELLIEGPVVAKGYLDDPEKTAAAFITSPRWAERIGHQSHTRNFFRTGDLVQYNTHGTIRYIGRTDSQVKINGQRTDLGLVEQQSNSLGGCFDVTILAATPKGSQQELTLAAFLSHKEEKEELKLPAESSMPKSIEILEVTEELAAHIQRIKVHLSETLPSYMVPLLFIPISRLPLTTTGKTNRLHLRDMIMSRSRADLLMATKKKSPEKKTLTKAEQCIKSLVLAVFEAEETSIHMKENFMLLGGDSLAAIRLVSMARRQNMILTVDEVLTSTNLSELAKMLRKSSPSVSRCSPFQHFKDSKAVLDVLAIATKHCNVSENQIEDIYPTTPLQAGLISQTTITPDMYAGRFVYQLPFGTNLVRFEDAWTTTINANPILRTRLIQTSSGETFQVVIKSLPHWTNYLSIAAWLHQGLDRRYDLGGNLLHLGTAGMGTRSDDPMYFILQMHHALYDGWSLPLILQQVEAAYKGESLIASQFYPFVRYCQDQDLAASKQFWNNLLSDATATVFPEIISPQYIPAAASTLEHSLGITLKSRGRYTVSSMIRLAWIILLSSYTGNEDVIFGATVAGRTTPLEGISELVGPTIATVPVRWVLKTNMTVKEALERLQEQSNSMIPFEQTGLQNISRMGQGLAAACKFQNLLVIQPESDTSLLHLFRNPEKISGALDGFTTYPLTVLCNLHQNSLLLEAAFDDHVIPEIQNEAQTITKIDLLTRQDIEHLVQWSTKAPKRINSCVHELIRIQVNNQPLRPAVCAWDGNLTYQELDRASTAVAIKLRDLGVEAEVVVPILIEKSKWTTIAMIAVMKSGGAFILLDTNQPPQRHQDICQQIGATTIISSIINAGRSERLASNVLIVGERFSLDSSSSSTLDNVEYFPRSPLYMVFTSGSTGKPKGVVIEHGSYATNAVAHRKAHQICSTTRAQQVSSYAFDAVMLDTMTVLVAGGCVCVATESESRNDIASAINKFEANWIVLTPSVLKLLDPQDVPSLRTIIAVGESMSLTQVQLWAEKVDLFCGYGPAECSAAVTSQRIRSVQSNPRNIGCAEGGTFWVVSPNDSDLLLPIGAVGELVIEGPIVGRGYFNEPEKTKDVFIESTAWLHHFRDGPKEKLYKTGDLVQYNMDGTVNYMGRKDRQVKLRGQRLEPGEIEHKIREAFSEPINVVVEVIQPSGVDSKPILGAFLERKHESTIGSESKTSVSFVRPDHVFRRQVAEVEWKLRVNMPAFMVPTVFLLLEYLPMSHTGKTNRKQLQIEAAALPWTTLFDLGGVLQDRTATHLLPEENIAIWINEVVLSLVKVDDPTYLETLRGQNVILARVGIDSIEMMALARSISRKYEVELPLSIFINSNATIRDIAEKVKLLRENSKVVESTLHLDVYEEFLALDAELSKLKEPPICHDESPKVYSGRRFFLTGGTGFLGSEILRQLVNLPQTTLVVVLVRANTEEHAMARLVDSAQAGRWWHDHYRARIEAWPGDLAKPNLGLQPAHWKKLYEMTTRGHDQFQAIIHNGVEVHWNKDYATLRAPNVISTVQILSLLSHSPLHIAFSYISAALPEIEGKDDIEAAMLLSSADGYSQTKFLSELLVAAFAKRRGSQLSANSTTSIVRPGLILGSGEHGVSNLDDFIWRLVAASVGMGAANAESIDSWVMMSGVDRVAKIVVDASLRKDEGLHVLNIQSGISTAGFWEAVEDGLGIQLDRYDGQTWMVAIEAKIEKIGKFHPLWSVLNFLKASKGCIGSKTLASVSIDESGYSPVQCIRKSVQYLQSVGYFQHAAGHSEIIRDESKLVFQRSGRIR